MLVIIFLLNPLGNFLTTIYEIDSTAIVISFIMVRTDESFETLLFFSYDYLMTRQQAHEKPPKKVMDIVKRLEEGLFKSASTKVCYFSSVLYLVERVSAMMKR